MAADPKPEEISHPPMDQLQGLEYCIDSNPSWGESIALGFQHYILALGTAVMIPSFLVPLMGGNHGDKVRVVQTLLFVEGINTLLQTLFGTRLPTVIGGSYAFMVPIVSIIHDPSLTRIPDDHLHNESSPRCSDSVVKYTDNSRIQSTMGHLFQVLQSNWNGSSHCISRIFLPSSYILVVLTVVASFFDESVSDWTVCRNWHPHAYPVYNLFPGVTPNPSYLKGFQTKQLPILERFALLISITVIWAYAHLLTASGAYKHRPEITQINCRTDKAYLISSAPWIKIPYPLQWGAPTFDAGHCFGMMAAVFVSLIESTGAYKAASRLASATPPPAHVLSRGIGWQGIGILLDGLFGTLTGSTVSVVIQISAGFMIFFSILGKFGALFASIPFPIFGAVYCVLFGLVASVGLSFLQFTNMNSMRNLFITGVAFFLGLSVPEYFREYTSKAYHGPAHTRAGWFNDYLNTIFFSSPTVALIVAVFLDNTLDYKDSARDRGMPWWVKFRTFKGDSRNEEFYTLPFNLNRFFPPS
ncbi:hypothetical protein POTOM_016974 [Populus tomentosa]|uniref:Nucleobase-ascorbate transporter 2 n=1 Tax=Populus tomentosa TaxID=118781 RepID=A0A8X8D476_POPTO|nr:hypothetical protein POTOM_016974 [Populus tomentosa]